MTLTDRLLRHQNHPATLLLDSIAAIAAAALLWQQHLIRAAIVVVALPPLAAAMVIAFANLEKVRAITPARLAMRVAGAILLCGGAWWRSPLLCAVGVIVIALTAIDVPTTGAQARALAGSLGNRRASIRAVFDRWTPILVFALMAVMLADVLVLYFSGHEIRGYLTENSDLLYLPTLFVDVGSQGGRLGDWYLTPAPYFFPDWIVYFVAHVLAPTIFIRIALFAAAQTMVAFAAFWMLARSVSRSSNAVIDAALMTMALVWLAVNAGEPFVILFASASHFGAFICSIVLAALWIRHATGDGAHRVALACALGALAFLATLSDGLFVVEAIVPFIAAAALSARGDDAPRIQRRWMLAAVWLVAAAVIPLAVSHVPIPPPTINVSWAPTVGDQDRSALEAKFHLGDAEFRGGRLWTYSIRDTTTANVSALVGDPRVEDTEHIDRGRFTVDGASGPVARAVSTMPVGFAAATLVLLGVLLVWRNIESLQRHAIPVATTALIALVPICALLGAWFYGVIVPKHTRYPLSIGFEKVFGNSADLYTLVYRLATGIPAFGVVLLAYVAVLAWLLRDRLRARAQPTDPAPLAWVALFSLCALCATCMTVSLLTDLPVMPRYVIPVFAWPIAIVVLFLGHSLGSRYAAFGTAALSIATVALTMQTYRVAQNSGVNTQFYPPEIACIDTALQKDGLHSGIAQYWDAKYLQDFSRGDLRIGQYLENLEEMRWITSDSYFRERYDFAVVDENAEPTYKISLDALTRINGAPRQAVRCGSRSLYVFGKDRLRVTPPRTP